MTAPELAAGAPGDPIVVARDLSFRYPGAQRDTLRNVTLEIPRGGFVAVVGDNGSGKTTLCKTFNGLVPHYWAGEFAGEVIVDGVDTFTSSVADLSRTVGYVYQDFQNQLVRPTVLDEVGFAPINFGLVDHRERAWEALAMLGITELADKFIWQLSGGQAHLVALAAVLAMRPRLMVVDEPVAELDPARAEVIYERLTELNEQHGITVVTIEHHAEFIARYAHSVVLMADGAPRWHLPVDEAFARSDELERHGIPAPQTVRAVRALGLPSSPRTVAAATVQLRPLLPADSTLSSDSSVSSDSTLPSDSSHPPSPTPLAESWIPALESGKESSSRRHGAGEGKVVVSVRGLEHAYRSVSGAVEPVLRGIDLDLHAGERVALVGSNGSGKTTLLRSLAGLVVPRVGTVVVDGVDTRSASPAVLADHVAYLLQHPQQMFLTESVRSDVGLFPRQRKRPGTDELVERVLHSVRLTELADRDGRALSGGQQRRGTLAIGLAMRPTLLLMDEPTSSLDVTGRDDVITMLTELRGSIECAVIATHDMHLVCEWASRVVVLHEGRVLADATPREVMANPLLLEQARLRPPQVTQIGLSLGLEPPPLSVAELVDTVAGRGR
ncbi:ABC transporter ATP-binding protein [Micrococcus terreus]|uniref:ABC transporter ATP-binding protein n=1 Tax=Micrococcus terreus TaxID=574650 RepID=UPI0023F97304|nr:ABC transporter ATP-binding protein [Micrococcus terreus]